MAALHVLLRAGAIIAVRVLFLLVQHAEYVRSAVLHTVLRRDRGGLVPQLISPSHVHPAAHSQLLLPSRLTAANSARTDTTCTIAYVLQSVCMYSAPRVFLVFLGHGNHFISFHFASFTFTSISRLFFFLRPFFSSRTTRASCTYSRHSALRTPYCTSKSIPYLDKTGPCLRGSAPSRNPRQQALFYAWKLGPKLCFSFWVAPASHWLAAAAAQGVPPTLEPLP